MWCQFVDANYKIIVGLLHFIAFCGAIIKWHAKLVCHLCVTFLSIVDVVRGSHVTTVDDDRFCGADDNVGGFGNVLVTGRHTQANILNSFICLFFTSI